MFNVVQTKNKLYRGKQNEYQKASLNVLLDHFEGIHVFDNANDLVACIGYLSGNVTQIITSREGIYS